MDANGGGCLTYEITIHKMYYVNDNMINEWKVGSGSHNSVKLIPVKCLYNKYTLHVVYIF